MDKSASSSKRTSSEPLTQAKRANVIGELASTRGVTKVGLSRTLKILHDKGLLRDDLSSATSEQGYLRQVQRCFNLEGERPTPFGPLLVETELPVEQLVDADARRQRKRNMYYISPFALLFTICNVSLEFFHLVRQALGSQGMNVLRIVLYLDGINPGNPLAPDPLLLLQAIYWTFCELPNWFLRKKDAWFIFSLVKELWAEELPGKLSELAKIILLVFFPPQWGSFSQRHRHHAWRPVDDRKSDVCGLFG